MSSARASIGLNFATNLLLAMIGLASSAAAGRLLGPSGRGALAAIQIYPTFASLIGMIGLSEAVVYWLSRRPEEAEGIIGTSVLITAAASTLVACLLLPLLPHLLHAYTPSIVRAARLFVSAGSTTRS